jgi:hypothetical protein
MEVGSEATSSIGRASRESNPGTENTENPATKKMVPTSVNTAATM